MSLLNPSSNAGAFGCGCVRVSACFFVRRSVPRLSPHSSVMQCNHIAVLFVFFPGFLRFFVGSTMHTFILHSEGNNRLRCISSGPSVRPSVCLSAVCPCACVCASALSSVVRACARQDRPRNSSFLCTQSQMMCSQPAV